MAKRSKKTLLDLKPPKGWVYEAKVVQLYDEPVDAQLLIEMELAGWLPVPQSRHRRTPVIWGGMRLMERPEMIKVMTFSKAFDKHQEQLHYHTSGKSLQDDLPAGFTALANPPEMPQIATDRGWEDNPKYRKE